MSKKKNQTAFSNFIVLNFDAECQDGQDTESLSISSAENFLDEDSGEDEVAIYKLVRVFKRPARPAIEQIYP
jgi:hypothetical protein